MSHEGPKRRLLEVIYERGPVGDEALAGELGDQAGASDVAPMTAELETQGLIADSEVAPRRWQITDAGRRALGHDPGR